MISYLLQHCPLFLLLAKTYFAPVVWRLSKVLKAFLHVLSQGRQLSIRNIFYKSHTIALSYHQNKKRNTCAN